MEERSPPAVAGPALACGRPEDSGGGEALHPSAATEPEGRLLTAPDLLIAGVHPPVAEHESHREPDHTGGSGPKEPVGEAQVVVVRFHVSGEPGDRVALSFASTMSVPCHSGRIQNVRAGSHRTAILLPGAGGLCSRWANRQHALERVTNAATRGDVAGWLKVKVRGRRHAVRGLSLAGAGKGGGRRPARS